MNRKKAPAANFIAVESVVMKVNQDKTRLRARGGTVSRTKRTPTASGTCGHEEGPFLLNNTSRGRAASFTGETVFDPLERNGSNMCEPAATHPE